MIDQRLLARLQPFEDLIKDAANKTSVSEALIKAIILRETKCNPWAMRYEPTFSYSYMPANYSKSLGISFSTELNAQKCSWGLMQIMGCIARELGFDDHLTKLVTPELCIYWGARKLAKLTTKYSYLPDAVAAYNAGNVRKDDKQKYVNQDYVDEVFEWMQALGAAS